MTNSPGQQSSATEGTREIPVRNLHEALDHGDSDLIAAAVSRVEAGTSSEIVVKLSAATADGEMQEIARAEFIRLGLSDLKPDNGILVYVSLNRRAVEIVAGSAAVGRLSAELWQQAAAAVADGFRQGAPADGIIRAVELMGKPLAEVFPPGSDPEVDLPNISEEL